MKARASVLVVLGLVLSTVGWAHVSRAAAEAQDAVAIRKTLDEMNRLCAARDIPGFVALFDDRDDVMFVGSDKDEVFRGPVGVQRFTKMLLSQAFVFSFDLQDVSINQDGNFAWAFVDGNMIRTTDRGPSAGKVSKRPYRFSIAMVKKSGQWKWEIFHGAVPGAE